MNAWPRFREWIAINRDGLRQQRRLSRWAAEWIAADRDPRLLLRESRLYQMAGWMAETELALSDNEAEYLEMSIQARQERIAADQARHQRELDTVRQLANEEQTRADEQAQAAKKLRRRACYLTIALVAAGILALAALSWAGKPTLTSNWLRTMRQRPSPRAINAPQHKPKPSFKERKLKHKKLSLYQKQNNEQQPRRRRKVSVKLPFHVNWRQQLKPTSTRIRS